MSAFRDALSRLTQALSKPASTPVSTDDGGEFADLLDGLGATDAGGDDALGLRDAQIDELKRNLASMREVADTLAETQRARLAAEARVVELEARLDDGAPTDPDEERSVVALERKVGRLEAAVAKERERADKLRTRLDSQREKTAERHRVAAERWHELRRIGRERRALEDRLRHQDTRLEEVAGLLPGLRKASGEQAAGVVSRLVEIMGDPATVGHPEAAESDTEA